MKRIPLILSLMFTLSAPISADRSVNGVHVLTTLEEMVDPATSAVIVVDMQNGIVSAQGQCQRKDKSTNPDPAKHEVVEHYREQVKNIQAFLKRARDLKIPVIYAEYVHQADNGRMLVNGPEYWTWRKADWVASAVAGTWEADTIPELEPQPGDPVIRKGRANTFYKTYLDDLLKEKNIKSVLLTGTAGGGCVFATAMGALERGYYAVFVKDCIDQPTYVDNDLIKGRFPVYQAEEVYTAWDKLSSKPGMTESVKGAKRSK
jgi:ureidoacrylate peracid hydrolase